MVSFVYFVHAQPVEGHGRNQRLMELLQQRPKTIYFVSLGNTVSISAINARNQIRGVIKFIQLGDAVSEVEVDTDGGVLISVIRTSSLVDMGLRVGVEVIAVVKATEVALTKP